MNARITASSARGRGVLGRIRAYFRRPLNTGHVERRTEWLVRQHGRHPKVSAFNEMIRLSRMPDEAARARSTSENQDLSIVVNSSERVPRKTLFELEKTVLEKGVEEAAMSVSMQFPSLAEILLQKNDFVEFVNANCSHEKWKKNLLQLSETNPNVRAVGLLLYLRKAYRPAGKIIVRKTNSQYIPDAVA